MSGTVLLRRGALLLGPLALASVFADPQSADPPRPLPPVYFNHADVSLDPVTYDAIAQSSFLKEEFSGFGERTVQRLVGEKSLKYTYVGIEGRQIYLAFFKADESESHVRDGVNFTMSVDERTELPVVRDSLARETHTIPDIRKSTVQISGRNVAQYDTTQAPFPRAPEDVRATVRILSMYEDYRRQIYPDLKPEEEGTTRDRDRVRRYVPGRLLNDVVRFTLTVNRTEADQLLQVFRGIGYAIRKDGDRQIAAGPEVEFALLSAEPGSQRRVAVDMKLNRTKAGDQDLRFGAGSEIRFKGDSATWYFPAGWRP
jgi:hypothetical protein